MKNFITILSILAFILVSCKKEVETPPKAVIPFTQLNQTNNQAVTTNQPNSGKSLLYQQEGMNQNTTTTAQTVAAPTTTAKGMNPAHGQPGHRCDIPVGAPLNTAVAASKTATTQLVSKPNVTVTPAVTSTAPTPKGMNPPHGQAGHRCEIPVGAPLNSPIPPNPVATPIVVTPNETVISTPAVDPPKQKE